MSAGAAEAVPTSFSAANVSLPLPYAFLVCRLPQRRDRVPSGAGYAFQSTASQGRAGGRAWWRGRARLGLDRCATLGESHGGSVAKGSFCNSVDGALI